MTGSVSPRSVAFNDRGAGMAGTRSRVPPSYAGLSDRNESREEVRPQDSASNAPHRRIASTSYKVNGSTRLTSEVQTERMRMTMRENVRTHTRSPIREPVVDSFDREKRVLQPSRVSSRAAEKLHLATSKYKEVPRE